MMRVMVRKGNRPVESKPKSTCKAKWRISRPLRRSDNFAGARASQPLGVSSLAWASQGRREVPFQRNDED